MFEYPYNQDSLVDRVMMKRWSFLTVFFAAFFITYLFLVAIDFVPEPPKPESITQSEGPELMEESAPVEVFEPVTTATDLTPATDPQLPQSIFIKKLDREITILNPVSRKVSDLDEALLDGVVRHPDSAMPGQDGNIFVLGHSSYLPQIYNKNFQAFNGIQELEWGDLIEVTTADRVHVYRVDQVYKAVADAATVIPIAGEDRRLTLATCNSFGKVEDRFIVEAIEVSVRPK